MNPYSILRISTTASEREIKNAYRRLVKEYHPDRNKSPEAREMIHLINEAYEILSDPQRKSSYDNRIRGVRETAPRPPDPREIYRREFLRKKREEKIRADKEAFELRVKLYGFAWKGSVLLTVLALIFIADFYLPRVQFSEKVEEGYQRSLSGRAGSGSGIITSYMVTENFHLSIPHDVHIYYDYYRNNEPVIVSVSPILRLPVEIGLFHRGEFGFFPVKGNIHYNWFMKYLLLITSGLVASSRRYSAFRYQIAGLPFAVFAIILFMLW